MTLTRALARPAVAAAALACLATWPWPAAPTRPRTAPTVRRPRVDGAGRRPELEGSTTETPATSRLRGDRLGRARPRDDPPATRRRAGCAADCSPPATCPASTTEYRWTVSGTTRDREPQRVVRHLPALRGDLDRRRRPSPSAAYRPGRARARSPTGPASWSPTSPTRPTARRAFAVLDVVARELRRPADALSTAPRSGRCRTSGSPAGSGGWYLLTYGPVKGDPDAEFFDAQGMARRRLAHRDGRAGRGRPGLQLRAGPGADGHRRPARRRQALLTAACRSV